MPKIMDFDNHFRNIEFISSQTCPYCQKIIFPEVITTVASDNLEDLFLTIHCPGCDGIYFEKYIKQIQSTIQHGFEVNTISYKSVALCPSLPIPFDFPEYIQLQYVDFTDIYNQAATAESMNLGKICGMGYRKALESLAKQYAHECFPNESSKIDNESLAQTINRFESPKIKTLAKAATWLGNDQTHMIAKHPEYSINQLKAFIRFLCQEIEAEQEFKKAQSLISEHR